MAVSPLEIPATITTGTFPGPVPAPPTPPPPPHTPSPLLVCGSEQRLQCGPVASPCSSTGHWQLCLAEGEPPRLGRLWETGNDLKDLFGQICVCFGTRLHTHTHTCPQVKQCACCRVFFSFFWLSKIPHLTTSHGNDHNSLAVLVLLLRREMKGLRCHPTPHLTHPGVL